MPYVTFAERYGHEQGLKKGREEGREQGRLEALRQLLAWQLNRRFGTPTEQINARLQSAGAAQLEAWALAVVDARSLEEVFAR